MMLYLFRCTWSAVVALVMLILVGCDSHRPAAPSAAAEAPPADTAQAAPGVKPDSTLLLAPGRVGAVRIGMRVGELRAQYGLMLRDVTIARDGEEYPAFAIGRATGSQLPALLLEPLCDDGDDDATGNPTDRCRIWRITIRDRRYRTASGLGVGSRYGDVRLAAPLSFVGPNPMGIAATVEPWQMNFLLDAEAIAARKLPVRRETIHDSVRVTGVQLYR